LGDENGAARAYFEALHVAHSRSIKGLKDVNAAIIFDRLAQMAQDGGHFQEAEGLYAQAFLAYRDLGPHGSTETVAGILYNLGTLYVVQGHVDKGERAFRQCLWELSMADRVEGATDRRELHERMKGVLHALLLVFDEQGKTAEHSRLQQDLGGELPVAAVNWAIDSKLIQVPLALLTEQEAGAGSPD
jgi:hypothetical protein